METSPATTELRVEKPGFFVNRNFALLWSGQGISKLGDLVFSTTLILWIGVIIARGQSWAPLAVSGAFVALSVPVVVIGPIAGVFVDRWDKRWTMLLMDASRAILIFALLLVSGLVSLPFIPGGRLPLFWQLGVIYGTVFLASACAQFFDPSKLALIGDIVPEVSRPRASSLTELTQNIVILLAPPVAAPLLFAFGVQWALLVNALSFVVSFLAILAIRVAPIASREGPAAESHFLREFTQGLRFFGGDRVLVTLLIALVMALLGAGALNALDLFFVTENLHTPASFYGFLTAASGAGAIGGAIIATLFARRIQVARMFWGSLLAIGVVALLYARLTSFAPALVANLLFGLFNAPINVAAGPLILHVTPREFVGRVMATIQPMMNLASISSIALAGVLASTLLHSFHVTLLGISFGPIDTIFTGTGVLVVLSGLYAMVNLRGVRLAGEGEAREEAPLPEVAAAGE